MDVIMCYPNILINWLGEKLLVSPISTDEAIHRSGNKPVPCRKPYCGFINDFVSAEFEPPHSRKVRFKPSGQTGLSVRSLHVLPRVGGFSGSFGFLPEYKNGKQHL